MKSKFNFESQRPTTQFINARRLAQSMPLAKNLATLRIASSRFVRKPPRVTIIKSRNRAAAERVPRATIIDLLGGSRQASPHRLPQIGTPGSQNSTLTNNVDDATLPSSVVGNPKDRTHCVTHHVEAIKNGLSSGRISLNGNPWVRRNDPFIEVAAVSAQRARDGKPCLDAGELFNAVSRPGVFVWAPHLLWPGVRIICPDCGTEMRSGSSDATRWCGHRTLHGLAEDHAYVSAQYQCKHCAFAKKRDEEQLSHIDNSRKRKTRTKTFNGDSPAVISQLRTSQRHVWEMMDTGRIICTLSVTDHVRSMSTRSSWAQIADTLNEIKSTWWVRNVIMPYLQLCNSLGLEPECEHRDVKKSNVLSAWWIRNMFLADYKKREYEMLREIASEKGDDVLKMDWTESVAKRCGNKYMFNAMAGNQKILISALVPSTSLTFVVPLLKDLRNRGVSPKVVYVDDECCGAWAILVNDIWPNAVVRLDAMHAIMRLTQTTSCTQHPWHGIFCTMLSKAIYTYDQSEIARLSAARERIGLSPWLSKSARQKYIPRAIVGASSIAQDIDEIINHFKKHEHTTKGPLLTAATCDAWQRLRRHIESGCVCDPQNVVMHVACADAATEIGGEIFQQLRTVRGASGLEGFHLHQAKWLGPSGRHSVDAALPLIIEGAVRWNRNRSNADAASPSKTPNVYAGGLLSSANKIHDKLLNAPLYDNYHLAQDPLGFTIGLSGSQSDVASAGAFWHKTNRRSDASTIELDRRLASTQKRRAARIDWGSKIAVAQTHRMSSAPRAELDNRRATSSNDRQKRLRSAAQDPKGNIVLPVCEAIASTKEKNAKRIPIRRDAPTARRAPSSRSGCNICHMINTACRLHVRIQWCSSQDIEFPEWLIRVFPEKKEMARRKAIRKATRATGVRGRPKIIAGAYRATEMLQIDANN